MIVVIVVADDVRTAAVAAVAHGRYIVIRDG